MKYSMIFTTLSAALVLSACDRPATTVVTPAVAPPTTLVAVPGPPGPQGATGAQGQQGKTGDTVVVVPAK